MCEFIGFHFTYVNEHFVKKKHHHGEDEPISEEYDVEEKVILYLIQNIRT